MVSPPSRPRTSGEWRVSPPPATGGCGGELQAQGQDKGEDERDQRLAIMQQAEGGRFILESNGESAVVARLCSGCAQSISSTWIV
jgi:hypothetical protein